MIILSARRQIIDAADLIEILEEKQAGLVAYEHKIVGEVIEIIKAMPDLSASVEVRRMLP